MTVLVNAQIVNRFKGDRFTHYNIEDWISYAPALQINSIDIDEEYVNFATQNGGILRFDKYSNNWNFPFTTSSGLRSNTIFEVVYNEQDGNLYAFTPLGIDVLRFSENYWQPYPGDKMPSKRQPAISEIADINRGKDFRFPPFFRPGNDFFPNFFTDRTIIFMPPATIIDKENREYKFTDRVVDSWQRLWLGSDGLGPFLGDLFTFSLKSLPQSIPNISVRDIYFDGGEVWIGGISLNKGIGGITKWEKQKNKWQYFEAQFINGIAKDDVLSISGNQNFIAFATHYGITLFDKKKSKWKTFTMLDGLESEIVRDVLIIKNKIYIATDNGLNWIELPSKRIKGLSGTQIDNVQINQLAQYKNKIYAVTELGLYSIDIGSAIVQFLPSRGALSDFNLLAIEVLDDEIWIAGKSGIMYYDIKNDKWHSFPALNIKLEVRDIATTQNIIWFATAQGLVKFDRHNDYWRLYTTEDGLISDDVYHIDTMGDRLWLSTDRGITSFRYFREGRID